MDIAKKWIEKYSLIAQRLKNEYLIVMVCNVKGLTKSDSNYLTSPIDSEYYSMDQYNEITSTISSTGFALKSYYDENDFISDYIQGRLVDNYPQKILVLNSAQKGTAEGRKSLIPAFCDMNNLLHTNSDAYTSSFSRNKYHWFSLLKNSGYNVCKSWLFDEHKGWVFNQSPPVGTKVICKLNSESSSIGLSSENIFLYSKDRVKDIKKICRSFKQRVIVQEFIEGKEVEVPVLISKKESISLPVLGIKIGESTDLGNRILDYDIRGNNRFSFYNFADENKELSDKLKIQTASVAYDLGIYGFGRIDYRIDRNGNFYITDISTNPHITKSMSFYYDFKQLGFEYKDVLLTLLGMSISRSKELLSEEIKTLPQQDKIILKRRMPTANEWIQIRNSVNWNTHSLKVHEDAAESSLYGVTITNLDNEPIAMGRVVGDGKICFYFQDIAVAPEWRRKGVGKIVMNELVAYVTEQAEPEAIIALMAADQETEKYYNTFGFKSRASLHKGPGMNKE